MQLGWGMLWDCEKKERGLKRGEGFVWWKWRSLPVRVEFQVAARWRAGATEHSPLPALGLEGVNVYPPTCAQAFCHGAERKKM